MVSRRQHTPNPFAKLVIRPLNAPKLMRDPYLQKPKVPKKVTSNHHYNNVATQNYFLIIIGTWLDIMLNSENVERSSKTA